MEKEIRIDVGRSIKAVVKKWYLVLVAGLIGAIVMFGMSFFTQKQYYAQSTIYSAAYGSYSETAQGVQAVQLYAEIINSNKIAERAASILGDNSIRADEIRAMVGSNFSKDSPVLTIYANSSDPDKAVAVANAMSDAFIIEAQNITGGESIQSLDKAVYASANFTGTKKKVVMGFLAGVLLVCGFIVIRETLSDRVYYVEDAELNGAFEILGLIPDQKID